MTKDQAEFQRRIREMGCIVCHMAGNPETECDIHHMLSGGRRIGEWAVLGLCPNHHRSGRYDTQFASRHPNKREFERRYGKEQYLLEKTRILIGRKERVAA